MSYEHDEPPDAERICSECREPLNDSDDGWCEACVAKSSDDYEQTVRDAYRAGIGY